MSRWFMVVDIEPLVDPSVPMLRLSPKIRHGRTGQAYRGNLVGAGGTPPYTYAATSGLPAWATLDPVTGEITGTPSGGPAFNEVAFEVTDALGTPFAMNAAIEVFDNIKIVGVFAPAEENIAFSSGLSVAGATGAVTWALTGAVPGLSMNAGTGVLSGTPTTAGKYALTIAATDSLGATTTVSLTFVVAVGLQLDPPISNWYAFVGADFFAQLTVTGGVAPYQFRVNAGTPLPDGITLDPNTGVLKGVPTTQGASPIVTLHVDDMLGATSGVFQVFRVIAPRGDMARMCMRSFSGNGAATTFTVTHDFPVGYDVGVSLYLSISSGPRRPVTADFEYVISDGDLDFTFKTAPPATHAFIVVMTGVVTS